MEKLEYINTWGYTDMNGLDKIIKIVLMVLIFLINTIEAKEDENKIDFMVNECVLKVPSNYDIGVSNDFYINFDINIYASLSNDFNMKNSIHFSLKLTDSNATKIVLDDLNKIQPNRIKSILKQENLLLIEFTDNNDTYIIGNRFFMRSSDKEHHYTKELIAYCNETWHDDMYIEGFETLADKIIKDFPYTPPIALDKKRALKIQNKLESIYEKSLKK